MESNFVLYYGDYGGHSASNINVNLDRCKKEEVAGTLFDIAKKAVYPAYALSGIDVKSAEALMKRGSDIKKIASDLGIKSELRPVLTSLYLYNTLREKGITPIPEKFPVAKGENAKKENELCFAFRYNDVASVKKVDKQVCQAYEVSNFFSFVFDFALRTAFRILDIRAEPAKLEGRGVAKVFSYTDKLRSPLTAEQAYAYYLTFRQDVIEKKSDIMPFPMPFMLLKAHPDLKIRKKK